MRNLNYRVCDLYTWQSFFYLDVLRGASVGFTQGLAMLARDGGGQDLETPCTAKIVIFRPPPPFQASLAKP